MPDLPKHGVIIGILEFLVVDNSLNEVRQVVQR